MATILFGLPDFSKRLKADLAAGRIVLGGCCVTDDDPTWRCLDCDAVVYMVPKAGTATARRIGKG
jgi:hypothetical protein